MIMAKQGRVSMHMRIKIIYATAKKSFIAQNLLPPPPMKQQILMSMFMLCFMPVHYTYTNSHRDSPKTICILQMTRVYVCL